MPDLPDLNAPWPDLGHEAIRLAVVQAIDGLADSFLLGQTAGDIAGTVLNEVIAMQASGTQMQAAIAAQAKQITALAQQVAVLQAQLTPLLP